MPGVLFRAVHLAACAASLLAIVQRITKDNLELTQGERRPLMRFTCRGGDAVMHFRE